MTPAIRQALVAGAFATLCALTVSLAVGASSNRTPVLITTPATVIGPNSSTVEIGIVTAGDGTVSKRPDVAFLSVGVDSQAATAAAAQKDLAAQANKLIAKAKSLGIPDSEINTSGYNIGPNYTPGGTIDGYRASEELRLKWHHVDTTGATLDALVQQGGATRVGVSFGLANPKAAQAEARALAIADARTRAAAMASAAGVKLGSVLRVSDFTYGGSTAGASYSKDSLAPTQIPVGQLDITVTVEAAFAIA
jgi:uncharacterized protein YggE